MKIPQQVEDFHGKASARIGAAGDIQLNFTQMPNPSSLGMWVGREAAGDVGRQPVTREIVPRLRTRHSHAAYKSVCERRLQCKARHCGIILNRWGHARLVQPPGWYYGVGSSLWPRETVAKGFGRIAIGHSELNGHQSATGAMTQGKRIGEASAV